MANRSRSFSRPFLSPDAFPPAVKWLLIVNISIYIVILIASYSGATPRWYFPLALQPASVVTLGMIWELVTYSFLHPTASHIFWDALGLWMFGQMLERSWGTRFFLKFYLLCAVGAALFAIAGSYLFFDPGATFIGMSGAVLGLVVAFGFVFYDETVLFGFILPMKAQYVAIVIAALMFFSTLDTRGAYLTHLGGMVTAFVYMYFFEGKEIKLKTGGRSTLQQKYRQWKVERAKKKFQVYLRKNDPDRDRWVN
ncbi:MAG TPA: rhomboid family intramembrane serine protease [Bryobacteraceae bacterium]|jgi:membrane associated rhomboid family serine protease